MAQKAVEVGADKGKKPESDTTLIPIKSDGLAISDADIARPFNANVKS